MSTLQLAPRADPFTSLTSFFQKTANQKAQHEILYGLHGVFRDISVPIPQPNGVKCPLLKPVGCPLVCDMVKYADHVKVRNVVGILKDGRKLEEDDHSSSRWTEAKFLYICRVVLRDDIEIQSEERSAEMVIVEHADKTQGHYFPCFGEVWFYTSAEEPKQTWGDDFHVQNLLHDYVRSMVVFIPTVAKIGVTLSSTDEKEEDIGIFWILGIKTTPRPDREKSGSMRWTITPLWYLGDFGNKAFPDDLPAVQFYATWNQFKIMYTSAQPRDRPRSILNTKSFSFSSPFDVGTGFPQITATLQTSWFTQALRSLDLCPGCRYRLPWFFRTGSQAEALKSLQARFLQWSDTSGLSSTLSHASRPRKYHPPEGRCTGSNASDASLSDTSNENRIFQSPGFSYGGPLANYVEDIEAYCRAPQSVQDGD